LAGIGLDADHTYRPGQSSTEHWWGQPTQPSVARAEYHPGQDFLVPSDREGNTLNFTIFPFGDSSPEHIMPVDFFPDAGLTERADYTLRENGAQIAAGPIGLGNQRIPVSAAPADYTLEYDTGRTAAWLPLSSRTITDWTFHSDPAQGSGAVPPGWLCGATRATSCGVIPLLFPRYDLGLDPRGQAGAGSAMSIEVTFGRTDGSQAPAAARATLAATFDDGATWTAEPVISLGAGRFRGTFANPGISATNGFVGLRLTASDGAGNGVTQTLLRAYALR
jgi:hypothetical protein